MDERLCERATGRGTPLAARVRDAVRRRFSLDVRSLAVFRIGLGLLLVADACLRTRDFHLMFPADGMFPPQLVRETYYAGDATQWSLLFVWDGIWWAAAILAAEGLAGACLAAGWMTTTATVVAWVAQLSIYRRTIPAANAGDLWLSCLLFWSCFLPLGAAWSLDARRRAAGPREVYGPASVALVLQVLAVYVGAGLAKWNASWLSGDAVRYALSVHDHGTPLGTWIASCPGLAHPMSWAVLAAEIGLPLVMLACPAARLPVVVAAIAFHVAVWLTMSVGLFAPIGIVAWLAVLPGGTWPPGGPAPVAGPAADGRWPVARWACLAALALAVVSFVRDITPWRTRPLPVPLQTALSMLALAQEWGMFGEVPPLEQWAYGRAELADGRVVDLLRGGRPVEAERPTGGFTSLPHHRWHKLLWILPRPVVRPFAPSVAAALARDWNARHGPAEQVVTLELRFAQRNLAQPDAALMEMLVGAWPDRDAGGGGNLERLLESERAGAAPR